MDASRNGCTRPRRRLQFCSTFIYGDPFGRPGPQTVIPVSRKPINNNDIKRRHQIDSSSGARKEDEIVASKPSGSCLLGFANLCGEILLSRRYIGEVVIRSSFASWMEINENKERNLMQ